MNKMKRTNHGKGSALAMGLDTMHVCVLLEFDERFWGGIDYCMCVFCWNLMKDFVLELIIACVYSAGI
jgi:hypothetical protein